MLQVMGEKKLNAEKISLIIFLRSNQDRGRSHDLRPPTPYVRVRTRRFIKPQLKIHND